MRSPVVRRLALVLAAVFIMSGVAAAEDPAFEYIPATEQAFLGIGCAQDAGGTCSSTSYWLGKSAGDSSVGTTLSFTPAGWAIGKLEEPVEYASFYPDESLATSYAMRTDAPITGRVSVTGWAGGAEIAADSTVRVVLEATRLDNNDWITLGDVTVNKPVVTPSEATEDSAYYDFEIPVDPDLEKVEIAELSLKLYVDSLTVLQNGFVDGEGGSSLTLPYYHLEPIVTEETEGA